MESHSNPSPPSPVSWQRLPIYVRLAVGGLLAGAGLILTVSGVVANLAGGWEIVTPLSLGGLYIGAALLAGDVGEYVQLQGRPKPDSEARGSGPSSEQQADASPKQLSRSTS